MARRPAGAEVAKRRVQLTLVVLLLLLAALLATGMSAIWRLYQSADSRYVEQALPLRTATRDIVLQMVNEETAVRGYMITGNRASLDSYFAGRYGVTTDLATISD